MNHNPNPSWWSRQSLGAKFLWIVVVLVTLAVALASPVYLSWL